MSDARRKYDRRPSAAALAGQPDRLTAAMRRVANDPEGRSSVDRVELGSGLRSFHTRYSREESREASVANAVPVLFYRVIQPGVVEIVRLLHERMGLRLHIRPGGR